MNAQSCLILRFQCFVDMSARSIAEQLLAFLSSVHIFHNQWLFRHGQTVHPCHTLLCSRSHICVLTKIGYMFDTYVINLRNEIKLEKLEDLELRTITLMISMFCT